MGSFDMVKRRKSKVPPPPTECPLSHCMRVLAGAWRAHVIWYLREGERCFTELQLDIALPRNYSVLEFVCALSAQMRVQIPSGTPYFQ